MTLTQGIYIIVGAAALLVFLSVMVLALTWLERKALARIQMRMGPMRVGFHGALQPIADAMKLVSKEDILPSWADRRVYWLAPLAVFIPAFLLWVTIPVARDVALANLDLGLFYIVAISVLSVMGLVMAGWSSANKYAMLGGLRAAGQLVSYEIPFIMAILAVAMLAQTLNLREIVAAQSTFAYALILPLSVFLFLTAGLAELGRTPFDIHHAESEVVGGPFVEYSGAHWAVFFLAEYINTFTIAALTALLFLGGWGWPTMPFDGLAHSALSALWFMVKTYAVILVIFWIRGTYPRLRIDQLDGFRLEAAGAAVVHQHRAGGRGDVLWVAAVGAIAAVCGNIGGDFLHNREERWHADGAEYGIGVQRGEFAAVEERRTPSMTTTTTHTQTAQELLAKSDRQFAAGELREGSETLWRAAECAMTAVAEKHGWKHGSYKELQEAAKVSV